MEVEILIYLVGHTYQLIYRIVFNLFREGPREPLFTILVVKGSILLNNIRVLLRLDVGHPLRIRVVLFRLVDLVWYYPGMEMARGSVPKAY